MGPITKIIFYYMDIYLNNILLGWGANAPPCPPPSIPRNMLQQLWTISIIFGPNPLTLLFSSRNIASSIFIQKPAMIPVDQGGIWLMYLGYLLYVTKGMLLKIMSGLRKVYLKPRKQILHHSLLQGTMVPTK